ncbi:MAG: efflux RND transporter permease subunit [Candidatus Omnitrophica bacterium]|nr:efflux RND transporter permease subunit [Candidatus Omnitrophota bacterium]MDD5027419.1 efflux RND transporter permease subunit [Candidatus Omnitrophota bacterium]MDD5662580.1 efflux RND transporter permease subunit [Candidatus Omnitrophota bacterium]
MLSKFFLERPVFAWVIAIMIMVLGGLAIYTLPIAQYPPLAPPSIRIGSLYTGASAETVENSVTQIIEQQMTGLDKMLYMSSSSDSSGSSTIELTFAPGTDPDIAWTKVQNKLQLAMARLPDIVQRRGVSVRKSTKNYLLVVGLVSEDGSMSDVDLRDYLLSVVQPVLARVPGVGEAEGIGGEYAMRIWFDPKKLTNYGLTVEDVTKALQDYNVEVSGGQFGGTPAIEGQRLNASIIVQTLLKTPEEFSNIPIRINPDGSIIRIKDVARTELGSDLVDTKVFFNQRQPASGITIRQEPGANALKTADAIKAKMTELSRYFPKGVKVIYPYDTTPFTRVAIKEVAKTLVVAIFLVFLVMYLFMGNMRATLIPTIAVPVVLLGTFAVLGLCGYSINMLTMFAMVLAIGLLVDDAIVVVENVERLMSDEGLLPREAAAKSMEQITPALIGIGLVLSAVFGPMAFFTGSTGVIYRQFSVTVIAAMLLSVLVALILTPVLCATFLKPVPKGHEPAESGVGLLRPFFRWFDRVFFKIRDQYVKLVGHSFNQSARYILFYFLIVAAMLFVFLRMPTGYLPDEDQGLLAIMATLPSGSTLEQSEAVMEKVRDYFMTNEKDAVESVMTVSGQNQSGRGQNIGMAFVKLKDWDLRKKAHFKADAISDRAMKEFAPYKEALVYAFSPPSIIELGNAKGIDFQLQDRGGAGHLKLMEARNKLIELAGKDPRLVRVRANGLEDVSQYKINLDWEKAGSLGVSIASIQDTISTTFGSSYVNDFIKDGRIKHVDIQADTPYRMLPEDLKNLYVRNARGKMVPYASFASGHWIFGSPKLERYNAFPSVNIWGEPAKGKSSGEAMNAMEELASKLPNEFGFDWTGLSYQERQSGAQTGPLYAFSILIIFLCVAALYESWSIPIVNLLMLPLGVFGATLATSLRGMPNDVYFQIGFLTTLGLSTKNAILIIQFAQQRLQHGEKLIEATLGAARTRFRPVIMTSMAFFFGVLPLAISTGAGAGAQNAIGTAVVGGMLSATFIDLIFIPLFFILVTRFFGRKKQQQMQPTVVDSDISNLRKKP